ncbi:hypothetical protein QO002_002491 [Pararhizobium capsulatum DSM 1112]|uniref:Uncharacterized protein n=1 Tax=Pararhizobium capsulatum DSM 1112 TaxID=1121113 RepID=A0ABU0BQ18_9HYPH|nr:hypothetical protein [Pararhizobium capsulatum DSM 1112]
MRHRDAERYTYQIALNCGRCGTEGIADVSQTTVEHTNKLNFNVDRVSKGFFVSKPTNSPETVKISCSKCDRPAELTLIERTGP